MELFSIAKSNEINLNNLKNLIFIVKMNEQRKAEIEKQARGILGNFAENLKKIKIKDKKMDNKLSGFREENGRISSTDV